MTVCGEAFCNAQRQDTGPALSLGLDTCFLLHKLAICKMHGCTDLAPASSTGISHASRHMAARLITIGVSVLCRGLQPCQLRGMEPARVYEACGVGNAPRTGPRVCRCLSLQWCCFCCRHCLASRRLVACLCPWLSTGPASHCVAIRSHLPSTQVCDLMESCRTSAIYWTILLQANAPLHCTDACRYILRSVRREASSFQSISKERQGVSSHQ